MEIIKNILNVGVNDKEIKLFEGQYAVKNGMAYNSYLLIDEKIAVLDTVDQGFGEQWLSNIEKAIGEKDVDYLVVHHMEPDHSANIDAFMEKYKNATIVSSQKAFSMMHGFFGTEYDDRRIVIKEGDTLCLGEKELSFVGAPMIHWPEVMVSYESKTQTLFSADAFGKFGTTYTDEEWLSEARRYYIGIVGKYGAQVQSLLKKLSGIEVKRICALHGPVLDKDLGKYIDLYNTWSSYGVETDGVLIAYTSVYGNTEKAVFALEKELKEKGENVEVVNLATSDMHEAVAQAFRYGKIVLATTTYNAGIFPFMHQFINHLTERNFQNRTVGIIENGTWAPMAQKVIKEMLLNSKNITFAPTTVTIKSAVDEENMEQIKNLAKEL